MEPAAESVYLHDVPLDQAWGRFRTALEAAGRWEALGAELLPLEQALGRVTADGVWARLSSPHYHAAAMDGYAIRAVETDGASDRAPVSLRLGEQAGYLDTGEALPAGADAVVPVELVELKPDDTIVLRSPLHPWAHVRTLGEDMVATELVLPAGQELRPVDIGAIAGSGHTIVSVRRKPRVTIIPTGSELVAPGVTPEPGQIVEYNSLVLAAQVETWGGVAQRVAAVADDLEQLHAAIREASGSADLVLLNAGSSAGSEDYSAKAIAGLGELLVHGVAVRPGHPVILGMLASAGQTGQEQGERPTEGRAPGEGTTEGRTPEAQSRIPIIGVPGYPASAALTGEIFVRPLLRRWLGLPPYQPQSLRATLTRKVHSSLGDDEYLRVSVGSVGKRTVATPLARGAGVISSLVRADGIVLIPAGEQGYQAGTEVEVRLYRTPQEIERTLVIIGSHDLTLDLLGQQLAERGQRLSSASVGSLGGLIALRRGEAHLAGSHLLDPETGEYNLPYIGKQLPDVPVVVLGFVSRRQGLIVRTGNPKRIEGLEQLPDEQVSFVNRQRGAGTRVLLDHQLKLLDIDPATIRGYSSEQYTHLAVAAAVAAGRADAGLGIQAAAQALGLDFVPLFLERYDLIVPRRHYESEKLNNLLEIIRGSDFRAAVAELPGYQVEQMGELLAELP